LGKGGSFSELFFPFLSGGSEYFRTTGADASGESSILVYRVLDWKFVNRKMAWASYIIQTRPWSGAFALAAIPLKTARAADFSQWVRWADV
jgi:hypothetical protein